MDWLREHLDSSELGKRHANLIAFDVGAHKGKFFQPLLESNEIDRLYLFEAHPENARWLRQHFADGRTVVEEVAVGDSNGKVSFHIGDDTATGSLLNPTELTPSANHVHSVEKILLDDYARQHDILDKVGLLKIDTQGSDHDVLKGAQSILEASKPLVIAEMIFAPLYANQNNPTDLMSWLFDKGYQLGGFFDEHFSQEGWVSWANACFFPRSEYPTFTPPFNTIKRKKAKNKFKKLLSSFKSN